MDYREEKEEQPRPVVHQWHLFPKLPKTDPLNVFVWVLVACVCLALVVGTMCGCVWLSGAVYDIRMGRP